MNVKRLFMKKDTIVTNDVDINIKASRILFDFLEERNFVFNVIIFSKFIIDADFLKTINIRNNNKQIFFIVYKNLFIIERNNV